MPCLISDHTAQKRAFNQSPLIKLTFCSCLLWALTACSSETASPEVDAGGAGVQSEVLTLNSNSSLIAATQKNLYRLSATNGATELVFAGGGGPWQFLSPADVAGEVAYIASTDNVLNAIDLNTGELLWEFSLGDANNREYPTAPSCSSSSCYVIGGAYDLYDIGIPGGDLKWSVPLSLEGGSILANGARLPLIVEDKLYIGTDYANQSYRLNVYSRTDGSLLQSVEFDDQLFGTPVLSNGNLLVVAGNTLHALDRATLESLWQLEFSGVSTPVVIGQMAIVSIHDPDDQYVDTTFGTAGLNINTGEVVWVNRMPDVIDSDGVPFPASDGSLVITSTPTNFGLGFFDRPRYPIALRPENGSVLWEYPANTGTASEDPLVVPGHLFYTSFLSGAVRSVTAFNSRTGAINWRASDDEAEDVEELAPTLILVHEGQVYRAHEFPTLIK